MHSGAPQKSYLADIGTVQLEFRYLSHHVGNDKFKEQVRVRRYHAARPSSVDG